MSAAKNSGGQRGNLTSASGRKQRSETSASHTGSRVEPSHGVDRARDVREKKAVTKAKAQSKASAPAKGGKVTKAGKVKVAASTKSNGPRPGTSKMKVGRKKTT